ncbi:MAG: hypothetical protein ACRD5J_13695 [Nitrososphaeraceae archaeon]
MNFIDSIIWLSIGFVPMFVGLELAWRLAIKKSASRKTEVVRETEDAHT